MLAKLSSSVRDLGRMWSNSVAELRTAVALIGWPQ
jgi:hypothetical protein